MSERHLMRSRDDRRRYDLEGFGSLRKVNWYSHHHVGRTRDGREWLFRKRGALGGRSEATAPDGVVVGLTEQQRILNHGGSLQWYGQRYEVVSDSKWKTRYHLRGPRGDLVSVESKGWGKNPAKLILLRPDDIDHGLLLYFTWLVNTFAEDDGTAAAASAGA